jgi:hypothetical protein
VTTAGRDTMTMTTGRASTQATSDQMADESMCVIAAGLTKHGLTVRTTGCDDSSVLTVAGPGNAACEVTADEDHYLACEYTPGRHRTTSPTDTARAVARMLGTGYTSPQQYAHPHQQATPASAVGRDMKARGMTVTLSVIEDDENYTVFADVIITNPARPERGKIRVEDNGSVYWECYGDEIPGGPAELAATVADILTPCPPRGRLAAACGACARAMTRKPAHAATSGNDNPGRQR